MANHFKRSIIIVFLTLKKDITGFYFPVDFKSAFRKNQFNVINLKKID